MGWVGPFHPKAMPVLLITPRNGTLGLRRPSRRRLPNSGPLGDAMMREVTRDKRRNTGMDERRLPVAADDPPVPPRRILASHTAPRRPCGEQSDSPWMPQVSARDCNRSTSGKSRPVAASRELGPPWRRPRDASNSRGRRNRAVKPGLNHHRQPSLPLSPRRVRRSAAPHSIKPQAPSRGHSLVICGRYYSRRSTGFFDCVSRLAMDAGHP